MQRPLVLTTIAICTLIPWTFAAQPVSDRSSPSVPAAREPEILPDPIGAEPAASGQLALGVTARALTLDEAVLRQLPVRSGAVITSVVPGSAAEAAGLPLGAVIVAFDGRRIDNPADLVRAVRSPRTATSVEVAYYHDNRLYRRRVQLSSVASPPSDEAARARPLPPRTETRPPAAPAGPSLENQLGDQGRRPLLGRVGRILDELVRPAGGEPEPPPAISGDERPAVVTEADEVRQLRQQVEILQRQLEELQRRLQILERRLEERRERP